MRKRWVFAALLTAALAAGVGTASASHKAATTNVTIQLKWVPQAQFAGYYAAQDLGYYKAAGLNVTLKNGGPNIIPEQVVASGQAQFGVDWLPSLLAARDKGTQLVNIAQVFARSGMTQLTWKSSGITSIAGFKGKKVANWLGGNQYELFAALNKYGMDGATNKGVTIVQQPFDMNLFLNHQVDSASAMTYNELAQVLESKNPKTGKLYQLSDLNVIKMQDVGTGMLEDGLFSTASWLSSKANQAIAEKVIGATLAGWIYCRDHAAACVGFTLKAGPTLPKGHQTWMMNEINKLIWPNASGIGIMNTADFARTAQIAQKYGVIKKAPSGAYRTDLAAAAVAGLKKQGLDVYGKDWKPATVTVTAGGK
ncbi:MAG: ABC transporter substrate-binding protein [Actinobacteria bacterium]|nr:ABC transporter substrate-binding protein [Actinomycetota bacterium]MBV8563421.1 ABC transporter substrate-binding protein [Actinomycetota bacterium]